MDWDIDDAFFEFVNSAVSSEVGSNTTNTTMSSSNFDTMDLTYELNNFLSQHVWKSEEKEGGLTLRFPEEESKGSASTSVLLPSPPPVLVEMKEDVRQPMQTVQNFLPPPAEYRDRECDITGVPQSQISQQLVLQLQQPVLSNHSVPQLPRSPMPLFPDSAKKEVNGIEQNGGNAYLENEREIGNRGCSNSFAMQSDTDGPRWQLNLLGSFDSPQTQTQTEGQVNVKRNGLQSENMGTFSGKVETSSVSSGIDINNVLSLLGILQPCIPPPPPLKRKQKSTPQPSKQQKTVNVQGGDNSFTSSSSLAQRSPSSHTAASSVVDSDSGIESVGSLSPQDICISPISSPKFSELPVNSRFLPRYEISATATETSATNNLASSVTNSSPLLTSLLNMPPTHTSRMDMYNSMKRQLKPPSTSATSSPGYSLTETLNSQPSVSMSVSNTLTTFSNHTSLRTTGMADDSANLLNMNPQQTKSKMEQTLSLKDTRSPGCLSVDVGAQNSKLFTSILQQVDLQDAHFHSNLNENLGIRENQSFATQSYADIISSQSGNQIVNQNQYQAYHVDQTPISHSNNNTTVNFSNNVTSVNLNLGNSAAANPTLTNLLQLLTSKTPHVVNQSSIQNPICLNSITLEESSNVLSQVSKIQGEGSPRQATMPSESKSRSGVAKTEQKLSNPTDSKPTQGGTSRGEFKLPHLISNKGGKQPTKWSDSFTDFLLNNQINHINQDEPVSDSTDLTNQEDFLDQFLWETDSTSVQPQATAARESNDRTKLEVQRVKRGLEIQPENVEPNLSSNFDDSASDSGVLVRSLLEDPDHSFLCELLGDSQVMDNQNVLKKQPTITEMECDFEYAMNNKVIPVWDTDLNTRLEQVNSVLAMEKLKQKAEEEEQERKKRRELNEELKRKRQIELERKQKEAQRLKKKQEEKERSHKKQQAWRKQEFDMFQKPKTTISSSKSTTSKSWKNVSNTNERVNQANSESARKNPAGGFRDPGRLGYGRVHQDAKGSSEGADSQYKCSFCNARFYSICAWNGHKRNCHRKV